MLKAATTITLSLLSIVSLIIMSATATMNFNLISNAMAVVIDPSINVTSQRYAGYSDNLKNDNNYYQLQSNYNDNTNYDNHEEGYDYPGKSIYDSLQTEGTFFISDAGESHGGFEFIAEYKSEFDVTNGRGNLIITQIIGLGDPLEKHVYSITDLKIKKNNKITMNIDKYPVEIIFVKSDEIWNHQFDNNYIASWGGFAPENEIKGVISPIIFPGLPDFWYVELRIPAVY
ncbi:MAG: hypothetical protein ACXWE6_13570 [Nitrososphaeraceae archaeon]